MEDKFYLLIVGSRSSKQDLIKYQPMFTKLIDNVISKQLENRKEIIIVHGGCSTGGDKLADIYAKEKGYKIKVFPANWSKYGKRAGYIRNEEMHKYISSFENRGVLAWWDGQSKGTQHSFELSKKYNNRIRVYNYTENIIVNIQ